MSLLRVGTVFRLERDGWVVNGVKYMTQGKATVESPPPPSPARFLVGETPMCSVPGFVRKRGCTV